MCNLSEGVLQEGEKKGIELGARKNSIETAERMVRKTTLNNKEISDMVGKNLTPEEVGKLRKGIHLS